jgi:hypothetical protein
LKKLTVKTLKFILPVVALFAFLPFAAEAQKREHLTEAEIEIVRDAQELDRRMEVFVKAIERRFQALGASVGDKIEIKKAKKDASDWGELPTGTRAQLINDIAEILEEAMNNIDVVYERDEKNKLTPKALKTMGEAAERFLPQLKILSEKTGTEAERSAAYQAVRNAENLVEAQRDFASASAQTPN